MFNFSYFSELERLRILRAKLMPADLRKVKKCIRCGFCCESRTCIPTSKELKQTAKYLKMSVKKCIRTYYAIDTNDDDTYFVKPLGENILDLAGKFIPSDRTYNEGKCVFLKRNGNLCECKIYKVRPLAAKIASCWKNEKSKVGKALKTALNSWENGVLEKEFGVMVEA